MTTHVMTQDRPAGRKSASPAAVGNGMNGGLPTEANHIVHSHVLSRAVDRLHAKYGNALEPGLIRRTVTGAYRELDRTARIKTFLPITAIHLAEDRLRALAADGGARPAAAPGLPDAVAKAA